MELKEMTVEELEARKVEIRSMLDRENTDDLDLNALEEEVKQIKAEIEQRKNDAEIERRKLEAAKAEELRMRVANGQVDTTVIRTEGEKRNMNNAVEFRNSKEYVKAYADYIKTNDITELRKLITAQPEETRALLTLNASSGGQVPVPDIVLNTVEKAWEKLEIVSLCRKSGLKGNVKIGFEIAGDDAEVHDEGDDEIDEEDLTLGVVTIVPANIKKWISISDEVLDEAPEAFLTYVYEELAYRIGKKLQDDIVTKIASRSTTTTTTAIGVPTYAGAPAKDTVVNVFGLLGDNASDLTVIINKKTYVQFKALAKSANFAQDVFDGHRVVFSNALPSYADSEAGDVYLILADLNGYLINYPAAQDIKVKYDDLTLATADLVKLVGRLNVGHDLVTPGCFATATNP